MVEYVAVLIAVMALSQPSLPLLRLTCLMKWKHIMAKDTARRHQEPICSSKENPQQQCQM